jgi:hypothetical protein
MVELPPVFVSMVVESTSRMFWLITAPSIIPLPTP